MGTTSTRERYLESVYRPSLYREFYDNPGAIVPSETTDDYLGIRKYAAPHQLTTSYRSSKANKMGVVAPDSLTEEDVRNFVDVTRNGLTEPNPTFDNGHEFFTKKTSLSTSHPKWKFSWQDNRSSSFRYVANGPLYFNVPGGSGGAGGVPWKTPLFGKLPALQANALGAGFIADTLPTKSPVQLSATLGEAMQSLPSMIGWGMIKGKDPILNSIGGEYLNFAFGIAPTASDIKDLFKAVAESSKLIQQYHRDSGRQVRRKRSHKPVITIDKEESVPLPSNGQDRLYGWRNGAVVSVGEVNLTRRTEVRTWFSGAYSYHLSEDSDGIIGKFKAYEEYANHVLGLGLSLDAIWQLTPWSWLLDWMTNAGDILTNASNLGQDGLVLRYGYLMNHVKVKETYSMPSGATFQGGAKTGPITNVLLYESKERVRATPYGFGLPLTSLTSKQWAILGALGLTKAPKTLF